MNRLRRFWQLDGNERRAFARAAWYVAVVRFFPSVTRFALRQSEVPPAIANAHERAIVLARAVERAARHLPLKSSCLDRAVALWWLLARDSAGGALRIGVRRDGDELAAHAWVEHEGEVLLGDDADEQYVALE